jgi:hypothetical protein
MTIADDIARITAKTEKGWVGWHDRVEACADVRLLLAEIERLSSTRGPGPSVTDYAVVVVSWGVRIQGVYPNTRAALESLPEGTEYELSPNGMAYNGRGKDRELRIRVSTLHGWS